MCSEWNNDLSEQVKAATANRKLQCQTAGTTNRNSNWTSWHPVTARFLTDWLPSPPARNLTFQPAELAFCVQNLDPHISQRGGAGAVSHANCHLLGGPCACLSTPSVDVASSGCARQMYTSAVHRLYLSASSPPLSIWHLLRPSECLFLQRQARTSSAKRYCVIAVERRTKFRF